MGHAQLPRQLQHISRDSTKLPPPGKSIMSCLCVSDFGGGTLREALRLFSCVSFSTRFVSFCQSLGRAFVVSISTAHLSWYLYTCAFVFTKNRCVFPLRYALSGCCKVLLRENASQSIHISLLLSVFFASIFFCLQTGTGIFVTFNTLQELVQIVNNGFPLVAQS